MAGRPPPARSLRAALSEAAEQALGQGGGLWGRPDPGFKAQLHCVQVAPTSKLDPASRGTRRAGVADATGCLLLLVVETKIIRLSFSSPEKKTVCSQKHMVEVIFYAEFVSNTISKKTGPRKLDIA